MERLAEQLYLIALDEKRGTLRMGVRRPMIPGICGALLLDLAVLGHIRVQLEQVTVESVGETADPLLDRAMGSVLKGRGKPLRDHLKTLMEDEVCYEKQILMRLEETGQVRRVKTRTWGGLPVQGTVPTADSGRAQVIEALRKAVENEDADPRMLALLSLVRALDLVPEVFERKDRGHARRRLHLLTGHEPVGVTVERMFQTVTAGSGLC